MLGTLSLQKRLLVLLLGSTVILWIIVGSIIYNEVKHEAEEVFDANLVQTAKLLLTLVEGELSEAEQHRWHLVTPYQLDEISQRFHNYEHKLAFQITDLEGTLLIKSHHAPDQLLTTERGLFETHLINGKLWRTFSLPHPQATIHVGELFEVRDEVSEEVTEHLTEYVLYSLPFMALLIWWSVRQGLSPITTITKDLARRDSKHLAEIDEERSPQELKPMIGALNQLFSRLQHSLNKERRFTADAAHELRTPLAAIKVHAQVAHNEDDPKRRSHALEQIIQGVDRTTHLSEQLLALARLDSTESMEHSKAIINLNQVIDENVETLKRKAFQTNIELEWEPPEIPVEIYGNYELISILFRNLIDNAIRYTHPNTRVTITLSTDHDQVQCAVRDHGPGIPEKLHKQIFDRFFRNSSTASGTGLGLSICQRIAEIHQTTISLKNCALPRGLNATVNFPVIAKK